MKLKKEIEIVRKNQKWDEIPWRKHYRIIRNLRRRIFKATRRRDIKRVRSLQKLILRSYSNLVISVRKVTQINQGKKTAGIDKHLALNKEERTKLIKYLSKHRNMWKPLPTKRITIPKKNGKERPLGIPTIIDRCLQNVHKNALEPQWEAKFEGSSYGFRPGRSAHDAMSKIFYPIKGERIKKLWIVEGDIKGCFDNIAHEPLLKKIEEYPGKEIVANWLKAGYFLKEVFHKTEKGTPQGGIISPLLANIALDGIEHELGIKYKCRKDKRGNFWQTSHASIGIYVRYADDLVILTDSEEKAKNVKRRLKKILKSFGLELSEEKTKITHLYEGFDFLGWNFRRYKTSRRKRGEITYIKPSKESIQKFKNNIKEVFKNLKGKCQQRVIEDLNPIMRGWANYHKNVVSQATFNKLDDYIFGKLVRWAKRTHPKKSWKWIKNKYWGNLCPGRNDKWVFGYTSQNDKVRYLEKLAWTKIERHTLVKYKHSPDDPDLKEYWENRNKQNEERRLAQKLTKGKNKIAISTNYKCRLCGQELSSEGLNNLHKHHIVPRRLGGRDEYKNLIYLHAECHRQVTLKGELNPDILLKLGVKALYDKRKDRWIVHKTIK